MNYRIWVGKRESDILTYEYFDASITYWGSNQNNNFSFCTIERLKDDYGEKFCLFVINKLHIQIMNHKNQNIEIHFYNNSFAYKIIKKEPSLKKYIVNINKQQLFEIIRHKTLSRMWLQNTVAVPAFTYLSKAECHYERLLKTFPGYDSFVIQKSISGGGNGTYLITQYNCNKIINTLEANDIFLISPYYKENISLSCHLIIDSKNVIVFPVSKQVLRYDNDKICYSGNIYIENNHDISIHTKKAALDIGYRLLDSCYRGICGLDFIFTNNEIMLIEINPRYQGSSYLINAELKKANFPSLFELNTIAFNSYFNEDVLKKISTLQFSLQTKACFYDSTDFSISTLCFPNNSTLFFDGLENACSYEEGVYLYRYLTDNSIFLNGL